MQVKTKVKLYNLHLSKNEKIKEHNGTGSKLFGIKFKTQNAYKNMQSPLIGEYITVKEININLHKTLVLPQH